MRKSSLFITCLLAVILCTSCSKFDNGPVLSLRSAKNRLVGDWEVVDFSGPQAAGYIDDLSDGYSWFFEFEKDGDGRWGYIDEFGYIYSYNIEWELEGDELEMDIVTSYGGIRQDWEIQRLTNNEMELEAENNPGVVWILTKD